MDKLLRYGPRVGGWLAIPVALIAIWNWYSAPTQVLEVEASSGTYHQPPVLKRMQTLPFELMTHGMVREAFEQTGLSNSLSDREVALAPLGIASVLAERLDSILQLEAIRESQQFGGFWRVEIKNGGDLALQEVRIKLPMALLTCIVSPSERCVERDSALVLGTMQPLDQVHVVAWTHDTPREWDAREIVATHSAGIAIAELRSPVGPFFLWLAEWWYLVVLAVVWVAASILASVLGSTRVSQSNGAP